MLKSLVLSCSVLALAATHAAAQTPQSGVAGPYLAARLASYSNNFPEAAQYFKALIAADKSNPDVNESAMVIFGVIGDFSSAASVARTTVLDNSGAQLANLVELVDIISSEDYEIALNRLNADDVTGPLLDGLLKGWLAFGTGNLSAGLQAMEAMAEQQTFAQLAHVNRAYMFAIAGDYESADNILSGRDHGPLRLGATAIIAHAEVLSLLNRREDAVDLLTQTLNFGTSAEIVSLKSRLEAGDEISYSVIPSVKSGLAEAFYTLATIVNGEASHTYTLLHAQAAATIDPSHVDAQLMVAGLMEEVSQYTLASQALDAVPQSHPAYLNAEIGRAEVLFADGQSEEAIVVLQNLLSEETSPPEAWVALGDVFRRTERFEEAEEAYSKAIELTLEPTQRDWFLYYVRGITLERTDRWEEAVSDFERALKLFPDQPLVLNYLGYGLVEKRQDLDRALDMIRLAVEQRPNDGFITDSLGWVLYRLGKYEEAVEPMERAVELEPLDPVINDHLGDVYWNVGRKREAEFQWKRALSFIPNPNDTEADPDRIRNKIANGLDAVYSLEDGAEK